VATTLYRLTPRGRDLAPVIRELTRWGLPEMVRGAGEDAARGHWAAGAVPLLFDGAPLADLAPLAVALDVEEERLLLRVAEDGALQVEHAGPDAAADARLRGAMPDVMAALAGDPQALGRVAVDGDEAAVRALAARATLQT
jgi:hypothetical protein